MDFHTNEYWTKLLDTIIFYYFYTWMDGWIDGWIDRYFFYFFHYFYKEIWLQNETQVNYAREISQ